ncbi:LacI family transcriptional regulator [Dyadobacter jejuensis]|uniref:LacI family transcriptional regulator n=1 Tax=Dyadobacter jejuensis TaxID=1082580 RepID=A0A316AP63_9BACT|nr:substrate-binding domain-containing protein [Dyadobacter jejuensis]PWJ59206.1 LacI family transcriptional regulator [Dyadobacter jejuensis]
MSKKKITRIKDIAEKAGTSKGTVDRVLHNRGRVAEDVKERVLKIIKELEYEPNLIARTLKSQKSYNFAALIPSESFDPYWASPSEGVHKANKELRQFGVQVNDYKFNPHDVASFIKKAGEVTAEKPEGIIIAPIFHKEGLPFFEKWKKDGIPFVLINTQIEQVSPLSYIGQDSYRSGYLAAKLISYGLSNEPQTVLIAHINEDIPNSVHLQDKELGFNAFFETASETKHQVIRTEINTSTALELSKHMDELLLTHPELAAIYVTNSKAYEIASYLFANKHRKIKLVGYDLLEENQKFLKLGYIDFLINQNPHGQGYWGIQQLANHLIFNKKIQPILFLPLDIITKENLDYYLDPLS